MKVLKINAFLASFILNLSAWAATLNVMAPLVIPQNSARREWQQFENDVFRIKSLGANAISTDIWWGAVERNDNEFDFSIYDRIVSIFERANIKWVPILSFHQCGGNVGDDCHIPLPNWLWGKYAAKYGNASFLRYRSEQGNETSEVISAWATPYVLDEYRDFMRAFYDHFANKSYLIAEINISLGSSGELRYPSYNSHDQGSAYPSRGTLQAYSLLAVQDFQNYSLRKYGNLKNVSQAWNINLNHQNEIRPPQNAEEFFATNQHFSPYGKDFFDWYTDSLYIHGATLLRIAFQTFSHPQSPYRFADIGAKIPGVHWRMASDRIAELTSGMISTSPLDWNDERGHGYAKILSLFSQLKREEFGHNLVLHFTCLEKDDFEDGNYGNSLAKSLVYWVGDEARRQNVRIKGENALAGPLGFPRAWDNIADALKYSHYSGVTILRMENVLQNDFTMQRFRNLVQQLK